MWMPWQQYIFMQTVWKLFLYLRNALSEHIFKGQRWKSMQNFWTGGVRRENSSGQFQWCTSNGSSDFVSSYVEWQNGQPDNLGGQQNCLHLKIIKAISATALSDRNCSLKFSFACQVSFNQKREKIKKDRNHVEY